MESIFDKHNLELLHVVPGYFCNLSCDHCGTNSGPHNKSKLLQQEISELRQQLETDPPPTLLFSGGEPTFHIEIINDLILSAQKKRSPKIIITTNGWFSYSPESISKTLEKFEQIDSIQLSFDLFHGNTLTPVNALYLSDYCKRKKINFNISVCVSRPLDVILAKKIFKNKNIPINFQKVESSGRAKDKGVYYKYNLFSKSVLNKKCPNLGQISYISGKGYSVCCSNLVFNKQNKIYWHNKIEDHISSPFYQNLNKNTFKDILEKKKIDLSLLTNEISTPCSVCEFAHSYEENQNL